MPAGWAGEEAARKQHYRQNIYFKETVPAGNPHKGSLVHYGHIED